MTNNVPLYLVCRGSLVILCLSSLGDAQDYVLYPLDIEAQPDDSLYIIPLDEGEATLVSSSHASYMGLVFTAGDLTQWS